MSKAEAKRDKQLKRELEKLDRGLRRGNVELVLEALTALPDAAFSSELPNLRTLLAPQLEVATRKRDAAGLSLWLHALGRDPSLLDRLGVASDELCWALLWVAVKAQTFKQAERLWARLATRMHAEAPRLAIAIEAIITTRGCLDPSLVPNVGPRGDDRLGIEATTPRRSPAPPSDPLHAESSLLEQRASGSWVSFAAVAEQWLARAAAPCAAQLCAPIAELALLELGQAAESSARRNREVAMLVLAADRRYAELARSHPALVEPAARDRLDVALALVLRVAFAEISRPAADEPCAEWLAATVARALRLPGLRGAIVTALSQAPSCKPFAPLASQLQELHAEAPSPALWVRAALALDYLLEQRVQRGASVSESSWEWIVAALPQHLSAPRELLSAISTLVPEQQARPLEMLEELLEPEPAVQVVLALFDTADPKQRALLLGLARSALALSADVPFCEECAVYHLTSRDGGLNGRVSRSPETLALFARLEPLLLPHDELYLEFALQVAGGQRQQRDVLDRYLVPDAPIDNYLNAIVHAGRIKLPTKRFRDRLRATFSGRISALTRGFELSLHRFGARSAVCKDLAELFVAAAAQSPAEALPSDARELLRLANRLVRRSSKRAVAPQQLPLSLGGSR